MTYLRFEGANFTKTNKSLTLPSHAGRVAEYIYGVDAAQSTFNIANPSVPASVVGTVTYGNYHAVISNVNGFDLGFAPGRDTTAILCVKIASGCSNWLVSHNQYEGYLNYTNVPAVYNANGGGLDATADLAAPVHGNFFVTAATMPLSLKAKLHIWTDGVRAENEAEVNGGSTRSTETWKMGTPIGSAGSGTTHAAYAALFDRILTNTELEAIYTSLKAFYDGKLTVS